MPGGRWRHDRGGGSDQFAVKKKKKQQRDDLPRLGGWTMTDDRGTRQELSCGRHNKDVVKVGRPRTPAEK